MGHTRSLIDLWRTQYASEVTDAALNELVETVEEWIDGLVATHQVARQILQDQLDSANGVPKPYRVIRRSNGDVLDLDTAEKVMDHMFALGGHIGLQAFWVYKNGKRVTMPHGGEVGQIARWLDRQ